MHKQQTQKTAIKSEFHHSSQAFLVAYLISEFGYSEELAYKVVETHKCLNMNEMMDLFLRDQNGLYRHIFIPNKNERCQICGQLQSDHRQPENSSQALSQFQNQLSIKNQIMEQMESFQKLQCNLYSNKQLTQCRICCILYQDQQLVHISHRKHEVCLGCMSKYLTQQIIKNQVENMMCAHCDQILTPDVIQEFVDPLTFSKYQIFLRNLEVQKNPDLKWCPNPKCSVVIRGNTKKKTMKCNNCGTSICTKCNREAHPKKSCKAVFKSQVKNWEGAQDIQSCNKCKTLVQKISGCNHMSCSVCRNQWCWLCGGPYSRLHFSPLNPFGCPGLRDMNHSQWGKCKIILWRITMFFLIFLLFPLAIPVAMIAAGPAFFITMTLECSHYWGNCRKAILIIGCVAIGLLLDPFFWIGAILYSIPKGISLLIQYIKRRRRINKNTHSLLRESLLREDRNIENTNQQI